MAKSKANLYTETEQMTAHFMKALAYPARLRIVEKLARDGICSVNELKKFHHLSYPTLSQHLKILEEAGLVISYEKFPYTYYDVIMTNLAKAQECMTGFFHLSLMKLSEAENA